MEQSSPTLEQHVANQPEHSEQVPLKLTVNAEKGDNHFKIKSNWLEATGDWNDIYVNISGFFGSYNPHIFAAAPEMLDALKQAKAALRTHDPETPYVRAIRAAIYKAEGRA